MIETYIALGGNLTGHLEAMQRVIACLRGWEEVHQLKISKLYQTSPVSPLSQPDYLNAVCRFETSLPIDELWQRVVDLEKKLGKREKEKTEPRLIDLDLLFYGKMTLEKEGMSVPHPRWKERLFVLIPLADVTEQTPFGDDVKELVEGSKNPHQEKIVIFKENWCDASSAFA